MGELQGVSLKSEALRAGGTDRASPDEVTQHGTSYAALAGLLN